MSSPTNDRQLSQFESTLVDLFFSSERQHTIESTDPGVPNKVEWHFESWDFFDKWFRVRGKAYFFLFRKNLKVTNIQFAELLSLIRSHHVSRETGQPIHELQFLSVSEFYEAIREIVSSFPRDDANPKARYELISRMYYSIMSRLVVVDSFFGSCAVFVPPNLDITLPLICAHSGYIHSCGVNVYTRKIDKAKKHEFFIALRRHLSLRKEKPPVFFMVYAHEDFTKSERAAKKEYLRDGLDDVKIYIEKFYMDAERLIDVVEEMRTEFEGRLILPPVGEGPGKSKLSNSTCDQTRTLWLLVDHSIGEGIKQRGENRFYVCYEQQYLNESPFQLFDENKPAWLTPTTIPHTLLAAMMNVTGMSHARSSDLLLSDPFVGTGTTWLEATRISQLVAICSDKSIVAPLMAHDNLDFFCQSAAELGGLKERVEVIISHLKTPAPSSLDSASIGILKDYNWAIDFYNRLIDGSGTYAAALEVPEKVAELANEPFFRRLLFYLTLRTISRSSVSIRHGSQEWSFAYAIQAEHLMGQIGLLIAVRTADEKTKTRKLGKFSVFQGIYSLSCTFALDELISFRKRVKAGGGVEPMAIAVSDVFDEATSENSSLKPGTCDVIITDPPYGFNTDDDLESLAKLYADSLEKMILALKQDGHLVLCLLDRSHTGRRSPYFTHKELITQQILSFAERAKHKREVIVPGYAVPKERQLFRPPYYWESERALQRAILHFRIRTLAE